MRDCTCIGRWWRITVRLEVRLWWSGTDRTGFRSRRLMLIGLCRRSSSYVRSMAYEEGHQYGLDGLGSSIFCSINAKVCYNFACYPACSVYHETTPPSNVGNVPLVSLLVAESKTFINPATLSLIVTGTCATPAKSAALCPMFV